MDSAETEHRSSQIVEIRIQFLRDRVGPAHETLFPFLFSIHGIFVRTVRSVGQSGPKEIDILNIDSLIQSNYDGSTCDEVTHLEWNACE